jgi:hypothetical protein
MAEESTSHFDVAKAIAALLKGSGLSKSGQKDALDLVAKGYKQRLVPEGLPIGRLPTSLPEVPKGPPKKKPVKAKKPAVAIATVESQSGPASTESPNMETKEAGPVLKPVLQKAAWNLDPTVVELSKVLDVHRAELAASKAASGEKSEATLLIFERVKSDIDSLKAAKLAAKSKLQVGGGPPVTPTPNAK